MKSLFISLLLCLPAFAQISRVAANCTGTSSCTTTGNAVGDLEIAYAGVNASATAPTTATGWTSVGTSTINGTSTADSAVRMACKVATGTNEASNTFTNATSLIIMVYRGQRAGTTATCASAILGTPVFTASTVNTTTTTETFGTVTNGDASSWDVGFGYCSACTAGIGTAPTNMANRNSITGPPGMGGHDTNGTRSSFPTANVTLTTAGRIITGVVEIRAPVLTAPTYDNGTGNYGTSVTVTPTIPASSSGCYTTDGSTPAATTPGTCSTGSTYTSGSLSAFTSTKTLKMIATESTFSNSTETDATYTINPFLPNLSSLGASGGFPLLAIDNSWKGTNTTTGTSVNSAAVTTAGPNELLVAFSGADVQAASSVGTTISVAGGGLTWHPVVNANGTGTGNGQFGMASVSWAYASSQVVSQAMTATLSAGTCACWIDVIAFQNASSSGIGASAIAGNTTGAPTKSVTTTAGNSWVWGSVWDWSNSVTPVLGGSQTQGDIFNDSTNGDSGWTQYSTQPTAASGTVVTLNDTSPSTDNWSEVIVEILHQ